MRGVSSKGKFQICRVSGVVYHDAYFLIYIHSMPKYKHDREMMILAYIQRLLDRFLNQTINLTI
jgi:hypothetical protein